MRYILSVLFLQRLDNELCSTEISRSHRRKWNCVHGSRRVHLRINIRKKHEQCVRCRRCRLCGPKAEPQQQHGPATQHCGCARFHRHAHASCKEKYLSQASYIFSKLTTLEGRHPSRVHCERWQGTLTRSRTACRKQNLAATEPKIQIFELWLWQQARHTKSSRSCNSSETRTNGHSRKPRARSLHTFSRPPVLDIPTTNPYKSRYNRCR